MKYVRFLDSAGRKVYGLLEGEQVAEISAAPYENYERTGAVYALADLKLVAPSDPTVIMCAGTNYMDHIREAIEKMHVETKIPEHPLIFSKGPNTIADPEQGILYPATVERVDFEGELGVIIGKRCKKATRENAKEFIAGYTCLNDVSARDMQWNDGQWTRGKGLDTFCPFGPVVTDEIDPANLRLRTRVNGVTLQDGNTRDMIFDVPALIEYISEYITLEPGDVIATGTPSGVGPVKPGDVIEIEIEGIGILRNPVVEE